MLGEPQVEQVVRIDKPMQLWKTYRVYIITLKARRTVHRYCNLVDKCVSHRAMV